MPGIVVWASLAASWATVVALCLSAGGYVDQRLAESDKQYLVDLLETTLPPHPPNWYQRTNESFQMIFDRIYGSRGTFVGEMTFTIIIMIYIATILVGLISTVTGQSTSQPRFVLANLLGLVSIFVIISKLLQMIISWPTEVGRPGQPMGTVSLKRSIILIVGASFLIIIIIVIGNNFITAYFESGYLLVALALIGAIVCVELGLHFRKALYERSLSVSPARVIASSLFFITILGLYKPIAGTAFIITVRRMGLLGAAFITYNVLADTISLVETRWILRESQTVPLPQLPLFLASDLILSAGIYLALPVALGQSLTEFLQAMHFTGPRPWLGILFWSTFSTSAIFYLFVAAVVIVQLLLPISRPVKRIGEAIQYESHPTFFIFIIASFIITAIFLLVAVSSV